MDGYRGLTVRNIAARMGYVPGTLYNVFENVDDLVLQLLGNTLDRLHGLLSELATNTGGLEARLKSVARSYIAFVWKHPKLWNVMFEHHLPEGQLVPDWYHEKAYRLLQLVEQVIAPLFPSGRKKNLLHHAHILWAGVHGICAVQLTDKVVMKGESAEAMADSLISNYLRGLRERSGILDRMIVDARRNKHPPRSREHETVPSS